MKMKIKNINNKVKKNVEEQKLARDRRRWREVSLDLCSAWSEKG